MRTAQRLGRTRALVAAVALVGVPALAAVATATPAQARCNGVNQPVTMVLRNAAGQTIAREIPDAGTCNDNQHYQGRVEDSRTDGSCASVSMYDDRGTDFIGTVTECTTGERTYFALTHPDGSMWFVLSAGGLSAGRLNFGF